MDRELVEGRDDVKEGNHQSPTELLRTVEDLVDAGNRKLTEDVDEVQRVLLLVDCESVPARCLRFVGYRARTATWSPVSDRPWQTPPKLASVCLATGGFMRQERDVARGL